MRRPLATCQCANWAMHPCDMPATQEDLLCDPCRGARKGGPAVSCATFQLEEGKFFHWAFTFPSNGLRPVA